MNIAPSRKRMSSSRRPRWRSVRRTAATWSAIASGVYADRNINSACAPANSSPQESRRLARAPGCAAVTVPYEIEALNLITLAEVVDVVDLRGIGVHPARGVINDRIDVP